jgi:serine phosphatase RsbU (regulator of sigma subunit)
MAVSSKAILVVTDANGGIARHELSAGHVIIGRTDQANVRLDSSTVSRQHAELFTDPFGRWWVRDLKSRNGTFVNGQTVDEHLLQPGDTMGIENFVLTLESAGGTRPRSRTSGGTGNIAMMEADDSSTIRSLHDLSTPQIAATHLFALTAFGSSLLRTEKHEDRMTLLCQLLVSKDFHGNSAMILRLPNELGEGSGPEIVLGPLSSKNWRSDETPYVSRTMMREVLRQREPVVASNSAQAASGIELSLAGDVQELAAIACPIAADADGMEVVYVTFPSEFASNDWLSLAALAAEQYRQADDAWEMRQRAQEQALIEQDLGHARKIQMNLIPSELQIAGLDVAIGFEPCKWVGGDYVDVVQTNDGRALVFIGDVCGKGLQAALITATLHAVLHSTGPEATSISGFMEKMNEYLCQALPDESFVTAIGMIVDLQTGVIEYVNAGHPPAFLINAQGKSRPLQSGENLPLGYIPTKMEFASDTTEPGDTIALYTDGLSELHNEQGAMLGIDPIGQYLTATFTALRTGVLKDLAADFKKRLDTYQGAALPEDDHTFILFRQMG